MKIGDRYDDVDSETPRDDGDAITDTNDDREYDDYNDDVGQCL